METMSHILDLDIDDTVPPSVESVYDFDDNSLDGEDTTNDIDELMEEVNNSSDTDQSKHSSNEQSDGERSLNSEILSSDEDESRHTDSEVVQGQYDEENDESDAVSDVSDTVDIDLSTDLDNLEGCELPPESMKEILNSDPQWKDTYSPLHVKQCRGSTRSKLPSDFDVSTSTPLDYYQLFMTDEVFTTIFENTNKYFDFRVRQKQLVRPEYRDKEWYPVNLAEMKAYFGLAVLFGVHNQPRYTNYWSSNPFLGNKAVQNVMTLRRYKKISEYLHINDREKELPRGHPGHDKLAKVRWLLDHVEHVFPKYKNPERHQSIDESTIPFAGRCSYLQYNAAKPAKRGIKTYVRTCATSAYCQQISIYLGKNHEVASANGSVFDTVWKLVKPISGKYFCIYFDNWYTSIPLLRFLYSRRTYAAGTIRQNRKHLPNKIKSPPSRLKRGEYVTVQSKKLSNLTCTLWKDTKEVRFASTLSSPSLDSRGHRRIAGHHVQVTMPSVATAYGRYMGGVDKLDRLISSRVYGSLGHGARKIWRHIAWYLQNLMIANAWILYSLYSKRPTQNAYDHFAFRLELAQELINGFSKRKRAASETVFRGRLQLCEMSGHKLVHSESRRPKRCKPHRDHKPNGKTRRETIYMCEQCNQNMCPDCFRIVHRPIVQ